MIFTHLCRIAAVLGSVAGTLMLGLGIRDAMLTPEPLWTNPTASLAIRHGAEMLLASIALGALAEIGFSVRKT